MALIVAYATAASVQQPILWLLAILFWLVIIAGAGFLLTGIWFLVDLIVWKINPVRIKIDTSIGKSNVTKTDREYQFKIMFRLEAKDIPIQINSPKLCFRTEVLESIDGSFKLDKQKEIFTNNFILPASSPLFGNLLQEEKYRLTFVAEHKERTSKEFTLTRADVLILVPTATSTSQGYASTVATNNPIANKLQQVSTSPGQSLSEYRNTEQHKRELQLLQRSLTDARIAARRLVRALKADIQISDAAILAAKSNYKNATNRLANEFLAYQSNDNQRITDIIACMTTGCAILDQYFGADRSYPGHKTEIIENFESIVKGTQYITDNWKHIGFAIPK